MGAAAILDGAPPWVYLLLAGLIALGARRLKTREVPIVVALLPVAAFFVWSMVSASGFALGAGATTAALAWFGGAVFGVVSAVVLPEPRGSLLPARRVRQPASWLPLALYLTVFVARFACGAWAAIKPADATLAAAIGVAIGAAMTARIAVAVLRWRPLPRHESNELPGESANEHV